MTTEQRRAYWRAKDKRRRARLKAKGLCNICGTPLRNMKYLRCLLCRAKRSRLNKIRNGAAIRGRLDSKYQMLYEILGLTPP